jgi:hypothetical protein
MNPPQVVKRYEFCGLPIAVENPAGSVRSWAGADGKVGYTRMLLDYGFIEGYLSGDGEELDCYVGPYPEAKFVYVVHQLRAPDYRKHDEDKVMLGFSDAEEARWAYLAHRSDGDRAFGTMSLIPLDVFRARLRRRGPDTTGKIHASISLTERALMELAGRRPRPRKRTVAGQRRAARYEQRLIDRGMERAVKALAPDLRQVKAEIDKADSFEDLRRRVVRSFRQMDPAPLGEVLRRILVLAELSGRSAAVDEV